MSGSMMNMAPSQPAVGGMPQMGGPMMPQTGMAPQAIPPQLLQMLQQRLMGGMGGGPGMPGGVMPQQAPMGAPTPGAQPGAGPLQGVPGANPMQQQAAGLAHQGRFGDKTLGHLSPGEVMIPPEMQSAQLMQQIGKAFAQMGMSPAQFTAGSPSGVRNPQTGMQEFSLLGALLPILGGAAGTMIGGPGVGTAIGGALGGAGAGLMDHSGGMGTLLQAGLGGLGGYLGSGGMGGGAASPAAQATSALPEGMSGPVAAATDPVGSMTSSPFGGMGGAMRGGLGAGLGSAVGSMLTPPPQTSGTPNLPPGFNNPMPPMNPSFNHMLGNNNSSRIGFNGYNPFAVATGQQPYNFYSPTGNGV